MSKKEEVRKHLFSQIEKKDDLKYLIENLSEDEIYIAEYSINNTSYLLKNINFKTKTCIIEIRKNKERVAETIPFDRNRVFTIYFSGEICFIPIDGKGLLKTANCDFVFFNEQNFCFVEMKLNATSTDERKIEDNRKNAVRQLQNTISYFDTKLSQNYSGLLLEAYIATPDIYPRENTAFQSIKIQFLEETYVELFESREKRYLRGQ